VVQVQEGKETVLRDLALVPSRTVTSASRIAHAARLSVSTLTSVAASAVISTAPVMRGSVKVSGSTLPLRACTGSDV